MGVSRGYIFSLHQREKLVSDRRLFIFGPKKISCCNKHLKIEALRTTGNGQRTLLKEFLGLQMNLKFLD